MYQGGDQVSSYFTEIYKVNAYGKSSSKRKTLSIKCKYCGRTYMYTSNKHKPKKCSICNHVYGTPIPINTIIPEGAKLSTHNQIRLVCDHCGYRAIVWVKKGIAKIPCPKCEIDGFGVKIYKLNPEGACDTYEVWEEEFVSIFSKKPKIATRPKKKFCICNECGYNNSFIIKQPTKCKICKRILLP